MLEIKNVTKIYNGNFKAIKNVNFDINDGEIFAFIGQNGAGKTTLIKSLVGILNFEQGDILINGKSIKKDPIKCKLEMAYIPDNPDLYENMTAIDYINFICDMYNTPISIRKDNIQKYTKLLAIEERLNDTISSLSHGMKQKISLVAALAHNPKILVMDEPFTGLDPKSVYVMKELMKEMSKNGKIIFFSTHILDVAEKLCDRVAIIKDGEVIKIGSMNEIKGDESLEQVFLELGEKQ